MPKKFTQEDVLDTIRAEVKSTSLRATARRIGVSAPFLGDVLKGNRSVSDKIADAFGFERQVITAKVVLVFRKKAA